MNDDMGKVQKNMFQFVDVDDCDSIVSSRRCCYVAEQAQCTSLRAFLMMLQRVDDAVDLVSCPTR